jgi:hypothetical protein
MPCICETDDACDLHMASCITCQRPCRGHPEQMVVIYNLERLGVFTGLQNAWLALKARVQQDIEAGTLSWLTLEQMVHVHPEGDERPKSVLAFYQLRDIAADNGW